MEWSPAVNPPRPWMRTTARPRWTGKRASGNGFSTYTDQDKNRFYVSPQVLAAILGKTYTDLGDGVFSFTGVTLDGFEQPEGIPQEHEG